MPLGVLASKSCTDKNENTFGEVGHRRPSHEDALPWEKFVELPLIVTKLGFNMLTKPNARKATSEDSFYPKIP